MNTKLRRRLDRRNAVKHIDYDASPSQSSSSSSFEAQSPYRTQSLDVSPLVIDRTSFRVEGIDGEFDRICRSLGLSGPDDFAIPAAAWEARKARSSFDNSPSPRFKVSVPIDHGLANDFEAQIRVSDKLKRGNECDRLKNGLNLGKIEARVRKIDGVRHDDDESFQVNDFEVQIRLSDKLKHKNECSRLDNGFNPAKIDARAGKIDGVRHDDGEAFNVNVVRSRVSVKSLKDGGCGIKGDRPPVLAPPPAISVSVRDNVSSTWDIFRSFGPQDDGAKELSAIKEDEEVDGQVVGKQDEDTTWLRQSSVLSESCSDISTDDKDDDSFNVMTVETVYSLSPNGKFKRSINCWQKGDFLGRGSFGTVYEGFTDDGFFFAVKEVSLLDQGSQGKQSIFQLEQEISLLSQFEHKNIVQYLGTDKDDSKLYIFLELVTKGSLASLYQKYNLQDSQVSAYTRQILSGLKYLHCRDVVHRDIKCANILVDASGSVKLADFGLAKATKLNDIKSCKGTAFWMAPEVVNRKNHGYGLAADIWSLGCTVLEMLTRKIPYSHLEGGMQALFRIGRGEPPLIPSSLSSDAQDFIIKCLQVSPDDRPTAAQLLDHPFVKRPLSTFSGPASPYPNGTRP